MTEHREPYPVRVDAARDPALSRGLWLVKWLLLLPHYVVLAFLWIGFVVVSVIAFVAILVTGRYPRPLFDYAVGVLRWTWRVQHYGYGALGTDRYPPFRLTDDPAYPAHLEVPYPEHLSRGLVLVKWWLLAIPHYLILAVLVGGGLWLGAGGRGGDDGWAAGGLLTLLVLIAGIALLFTGRYPPSLYDFVIGLNRWALRVAAYAALMTDRYPPFRLDMGGTDPGTPAVPPPPAPSGGGATAAAPTPPAGAGGHPYHPGSTWSAGRVVAVVIGAVLLTAATGFGIGGATLLWADRTQRDGDFLVTPWASVSTDGYAITSDSIELDVRGSDWVLDDFLGTARIEVDPSSADEELFVGIARTADADRYLADVRHDVVRDLGPRWEGRGNRWLGPDAVREVDGGAPAAPPGDQDIWVESATGRGELSLEWRPADGDWTVVLMRADGAADLAADVRVGATVPALPGLAAALFGIGGVLLAAGLVLVLVAARRSGQTPPPAGPTAPPPAPVLSTSGGPQG
ncbi:DUF4389 domain-containing protein [Blastococcus sp. TF02A-30]|uniref:DUF4389 domain-containing protein n=1 Tax=Blastococcus sp. TF02A-30 TaxID=2250580 RepID=UPI000DEA6916|nr:DUF4389 domain-containing protein [Blastococcus sp. TF02A-30]RBY87735.1 DUF4389 domain-containing protein [Blastococcus sp. TF02A-30]